MRAFRQSFLIAMLAAALVAPRASGHAGDGGTLHDIQDGIFNPRCTVCHGGQGALYLEPDVAWGQLFLVQPDNDYAADYLEFRVDPGRPWNSFLVDKLRAHLKYGEAAAMPLGALPLGECEIREVEKWILGGAPQRGYVTVDAKLDAPGIEVCDPSQPALAAVLPPADFCPVSAELVTLHLVSDPALEGHDRVLDTTSGSLRLDSASPIVPGGLLTGVQVAARAGTEHLTVSRAGDGAPLMVARGNPLADRTQVDSLRLPAGFGVPVAQGEDLVFRMAMIADRFVPAATAEAYVSLCVSGASGLATVEPFVESSAEEHLLTSPRSFGATAGAWRPPGGAAVVALRVWTDPRALRSAATAGAAGVVYSSTAGQPEGYAVAPAPIPVAEATGIDFLCEHDNTHVVRQIRWGCGDPLLMAGTTLGASGYPLPPPGSPGAPAPWCDEDADCACVAGPCCVPANLVAGAGAEDGRCALVGLRVTP